MVLFESSKIRKKNTRVFERKKRLKTLGLQSSIIHANERQQVFYSTLIKTKDKEGSGGFLLLSDRFLGGGGCFLPSLGSPVWFPLFASEKTCSFFVIKERFVFFKAYTPQKKETQVFGQKRLTP